MTFPKDFIFNQSNLQDYVDCPRRFQLRYLLHQAWPAVEAEPFLEYEHMIDQGSRFHKIVHQHLTGLPESQIEQSLGDDEVMLTWWLNYIHSLRDGVLKGILQSAIKRYLEITLSTPLGGYRVIAKYDLLVLKPDGKVLIIDWKTSKLRPKRKWLSDRLQSHIYPYVLTQAITSLTGHASCNTSFLEMLYWFTHQPEQPEFFYYNDSAYGADLISLSNLIAEISQKPDPVFPLTPDIRHCRFCNYRSLCNRGVKPGDLMEIDEWQEPGYSEDIELDYEQIGEIIF